jgi:hypothetical protein
VAEALKRNARDDERTDDGFYKECRKKRKPGTGRKFPFIDFSVLFHVSSSSSFPD